MEIAKSHPSYGHIALLTLEAVLEVVVICIGGYIAAKRGLFPIESQKVIANLNMLVFTPALIFSKLAGSLTLEKILDLSIIPFLFILMTVVSYFCGKLCARIARLDERETNFTLAMAVFGNSNSLPISLVLSLSYTLDGLEWDVLPSDDPDQIATRGILYLLIFQQLGQMLRWTWGYNTLLAAPTDETNQPERAGLLDTGMNGNGHAHMTSFPGLYGYSDANETMWEKVQKHAKSIGATIYEFMNAPLWAMLISLIVATITPLQKLFFTKGTFVHNTITSAILQAANVAVPLILVVLGANIARSADPHEGQERSRRILIASMVSRMVLPTLILCPLIAFFARYIPVSLLDDPIFIIVCFLLVGSPSAIQLAQICQINGVFESEMASILFWSYVVFTLPSTLVLVVTGIETVIWAR